MQDLTVDEDGPAEFICQYSRPVHAIWKKNDQEIHADGQRVIIDQDWNVSMLKINPTVPEDTGIYSCEAEGIKVMATLDVQGEVFQPERKTTVVEKPYQGFAIRETSDTCSWCSLQYWKWG